MGCHVLLLFNYFRIINPADLITGKEMDFHVSDMKPFVFDSDVVDPMDVARRDYMEYFVDKILQHRGNPKK